MSFSSNQVGKYWMRVHDIFNEADVIGTAVGRREIPEKYRQYRLIGQGSTSLILEKDPNTVLVLTRDEYKVEWLTKHWGLGIGKIIDEFESYGNIHRRLHDLPIYVVEMPKLYPLSDEYKRRMRKDIKAFTEMRRKASDRSWDQVYADFVEQNPDSPISKVIEWAMYYDIKSISFDMLLRNFMQTHDGDIIAIDPIISTSLYNLLLDIKVDNYKRRHTGRSW